MSMTFTKLFSSITESTIWQEDNETRLVWICMLAMADKHGRIWASVPGLAHKARVSLESCRKALDCFQTPDRDSRTKEHEGRRIGEIDGGWRLLNYAKYRAVRDEESILESKRKYINDRRQRERAEKQGVTLPVENVEQGRDNADADADADADAKAEAIKTSEHLPFPIPKSNAEEEFREAWNNTNFTKCIKLTGKRKQHLAARFKSQFWRENWMKALAIMKISPFCCGQNDRGWVPDIDWFIRSDDAVAKALEGKYGKKQPIAAKPVIPAGIAPAEFNPERLALNRKGNL